MKKVSTVGLVVATVLVLSSCATQPLGSRAIFYDGDKAEVYAVVLQAAATAPALKHSLGTAFSPWIITSSDQSGGYLLVEANVDSWLETKRVEAVSVVVTQSGDGRSQVIIQHTNDGESMANRISGALGGAFKQID